METMSNRSEQYENKVSELQNKAEVRGQLHGHILKTKKGYKNGSNRCKMKQREANLRLELELR